MDNVNEIKKIVNDTMSRLKDFQVATVERVAYLYEHNQNRVLVADEVGLGKTLVASGVVAKMAEIRLLKENDDLFKVIYVCSNQSIANQNIKKLNIFGADEEKVSDTRLSMQHLKITEQEIHAKERNQLVQLIPLTPETSFKMTSGAGSVQERALMYAVLRRMPELKPYEKELDDFLIFDAVRSWEGNREQYEKRVAQCETETVNSTTPYPQNLFEKIREYDRQYHSLSNLIQQLECKRNRENSKYRDREIVGSLRMMFAHISVDMLNPDFAIMDEFQRFRFLIEQEKEETESGMLAKQFLHNPDTRVLLLSATPYKLYSTLEEIGDSNVDEFYSEFLEVMNFLFPDEKKNSEFEKIWTDYSVALHELNAENITMLVAKKDKAEEAMYGGVCRTERISVMDKGDFTDDSSVREALKISEGDIKSYMEADQLLKEIGADFSLPVDYVKSCPYLMSFMRNYKVKENIEKYFEKHPEETKKAKKAMLWLDDVAIGDYKKLPPTNARLEELKRQIFQNRSALYLWVPPSRPYYEMQGVYTNSAGFSKILVFSSWEMVPRMVGSLISYEAERLTVGALGNRARHEDRKNTNYFAKRRFPYQRLTFKDVNGNPATMSLLCLIYPSKALAGMYNPIDCMNKGMNLNAIETMLEKSLKPRLDKLKDSYSSPFNFRVDERWYYLAPMLMDGDYVNNWIDEARQINTPDDESTEEKGSKSYLHHLEHISDLLADLKDKKIKLGRQPDDLCPTLINMILGSPAVCIYRGNGNNSARATELARVFLGRFNQPETTAIVELAYERKADDNHHWQNVLRYCRDGNFQAMFDEYAHLLTEGAGFNKSNELDKEVHETMMDALRIHSASYDFDTYAGFCKRVKAHAYGQKAYEKDSRKLRSHFAVGFTKSDGDEAKSTNRKDSVRNAFNSPLRPFVLATTSIGQEGLDFHYYCRKVMHWNLPSNPVDLEQREGRVNRYKCLAIRQDVAQQYGNIKFSKDVWNEMFAAAEAAEKNKGQSDLVPYWCLGDDQTVKIERIVPMYPVSKDGVTYERLEKVLSLYRLTLGQPRQEELLEYIFNEFDDTDELKNFFIDLSPYSKKHKGADIY